MKPRLLDLFSGAGGCAKGYQRAGFYVVGVDNRPQPRYVGDEFIEGDALNVLRAAIDGTWQWNPDWLDQFDAIHASPPCQAYSAARARGKTYVDLYEATRDLLQTIGLPWVIENVPGAPHRLGVILCGSQFGMRIRRHRNFETSFPMMVAPCNHAGQGQVLSVTGTGYGGSHKGHNGTKPAGIAEAREVMGIEWMTIKELSQAIPPAYTELIGNQLMGRIRAGRLLVAAPGVPGSPTAPRPEAPEEQTGAPDGTSTGGGNHAAT